MAAIRKASLDAHAAAKGKEETDAVFAAHAAGQAVGTAHVVTHALGAALYSTRAVVAHSADVNSGLQERDWQLELLLKYVKQARE
ncbi:putative immunity protein [Dehalococcoides mccartyi]